MEFQEGTLEKQTRVRREWGELTKGNKTCVQYLPLFEAAVSELVLADLGKSDRELFLAYLEKVGPAATKIILADRRSHKNPDGSEEFRDAKTWREAHRILQDHERSMSGGRSLTVQSQVSAVVGGSGGSAIASTSTSC